MLQSFRQTAPFRQEGKAEGTPARPLLPAGALGAARAPPAPGAGLPAPPGPAAPPARPRRSSLRRRRAQPSRPPACCPRRPAAAAWRGRGARLPPLRGGRGPGAAAGPAAAWRHFAPLPVTTSSASTREHRPPSPPVPAAEPRARPPPRPARVPHRRLLAPQVPPHPPGPGPAGSPALPQQQLGPAGGDRVLPAAAEEEARGLARAAAAMAVTACSLPGTPVRSTLLPAVPTAQGVRCRPGA